MPITVIAKLKVKPESEAAFEAAAKEMIVKTRRTQASSFTTRSTRIRLRSIRTAKLST